MRWPTAAPPRTPAALMDIDARFGDVTTVDDVLNHLSTTNA